MDTKNQRPLVVMKFGGGVLKSAADVLCIPEILESWGKKYRLALVISALGKTTDKLTELDEIRRARGLEAARPAFEGIRSFFNLILLALADDPNSEEAQRRFLPATLLLNKLENLPLSINEDPDIGYARVVSFGERISVAIVHGFLQVSGFRSTLIKIKNVLATRGNFREAEVDMEMSRANTLKHFREPLGVGLVITQGFLGGQQMDDDEILYTTLGREGSDYTAALLGNFLDAKEVILWKDVDGVHNADPSDNKNARLIKHLSFSEAERFFRDGNKIVHPKTIAPLAEKQIPLRVKNFYRPHAAGTLIGPS